MNQNKIKTSKNQPIDKFIILFREFNDVILYGKAVEKVFEIDLNLGDIQFKDSIVFPQYVSFPIYDNCSNDPIIIQQDDLFEYLNNETCKVYKHILTLDNIKEIEDFFTELLNFDTIVDVQ